MSEPTVPPTSFRDLIEQVAGIVDSDRKISNKELIEICKGCSGFDFNFDAHIYHEIAETALNLLILKKYGRDLLASTNPIEAVSTVLRPLQKRLPTQTWRSETQISYQQFSTPVTIAYLAAYLLNIRQGETVLEPSCGTGCLAVWAFASGAKVIANEIDPRRRGAALALGFQPYSLDAEFIDDLLPEHLLPDIVLANPPFSSTGGRVKNNSRDFGFRHIESALRRLKKGGRFAVILGESGSPRSRSGDRFWEDLSPEIQVKASIELPGREFYSNGTSVKTTLIIGTKSPAIDTPLSSELEATPHIVAQSVEDAFEQAISLNLRF
ncbi:MAG: methyltransferase [Acidobacteria bacterium]|nr:methyltransferase [Acidobacteriota bacterium]